MKWRSSARILYAPVADGRRPRLPWAILAVVLGLVVPALPLMIRNTPEVASEQILYFVIFVAYGAIGAFIASRRPENPIGWILLAVAAFTGLGFFSEQYAIYGLVTEPGSLPAASVLASPSFWSWMPGIGLLTTILPLLFPTGRLPSARWRPVAYATAGWIVVITLSFALTESQHPLYPQVANPLGLIPAAAGSVFADLIAPGFVVLLVLAVAAQVARYRGGNATERQQLKWFASAIALLAIALLLDEFALGIPVLARVAGVAFPLALAALPLAIAIAVLRYHLYEIDVILRRTLVYAVLTAILAGAYLSVVLVLQAVLNPITGGGPLAVAVSTLAVAALFQPVRRRVQTVVDRRFHRSHYDAGGTLATFSRHLRDEVDLERLTDGLVDAVDRSLQPAAVSVWVKRR